jgi:hypothetical protein
MSKWIHSGIGNLIETDEEYEDPPNDIAYCDYTFRQKKARMEARGLLTTNNRNEDILHQIEEFTMRPREEIPSIPEKVESIATLQDTDKIIVSWHVSTARIFKEGSPTWE